VLLVFAVVIFESQIFGCVIVEVFQFSQQAFVREIQRMRVLPVGVGHFMQAIDDILVPHLFGAAPSADDHLARCEIGLMLDTS
jgi:hypothetical protein